MLVSVPEVIVTDQRQESSQRTRLSGGSKLMREFLRRYPVEAFDIRQADGSVSLVVHLTDRAIEDARGSGLTVDVQTDDALLTRELPVGRGNRFANGGIPLGLGLGLGLPARKEPE